jgi:hypothetical protein
MNPVCTDRVSFLEIIRIAITGFGNLSNIFNYEKENIYQKKSIYVYFIRVISLGCIELTKFN